MQILYIVYLKIYLFNDIMTPVKFILWTGPLIKMLDIEGAKDFFFEKPFLVYDKPFK